MYIASNGGSCKVVRGDQIDYVRGMRFDAVYIDELGTKSDVHELITILASTVWCTQKLEHEPRDVTKPSQIRKVLRSRAKRTY